MSNLFEQLAIVKQELAKLEEMMHGNMLQLPWDKAPEWAQWAAMDASGAWGWDSHEPLPDGLHWIPPFIADSRCIAFTFPPCTNWKESKRKRP